MTPLTTDDDSSSTASRPFHPQRPRRSSRAGSVPSPLGSFLSNGSTPALSKQISHVTDTANDIHRRAESGNDTSSKNNNSSNTAIITTATHGSLTSPAFTGTTLQLRVRHLEHGASYSGYLTKFSSRTFFSRKQWKRRYFILHHTSLHCFKSSDPQHTLLESLNLCADTIICVTDMFSGKRYCLQITTPGEKNWYVLADTAAEMSGWLRELKGTVLRFRGQSLDSRPGTHYSDSSEMSDLSSSSVAMTDGAPAMPPFPSQYDTFTHINRSPSPPPPHPPHPPQPLDLYHFSNISATPRSGTPKPTAGSDSLRRHNSSMLSSSSGHALAEYASFGTIMEQADALPLESDSHSSLSVNDRYKRGSAIPEFPLDAYSVSIKSCASNESGSNSSNNSNGRRVSVVIDRPEVMITLPRRSSQRLMGSPSRPMSPVSSRPMSPNRNSPRSSLVVSPPPRSVHRPTSVSVRHSTQVLPSQLTDAGFGRSLSPTPGGQSSELLQSSLSWMISNRGSVMAGSTQDRSFRSPSRPSIVTGYHSRPMSPTFSSAPTSPLPEPPRPESPAHHLKYSLSMSSNGSSSQRIAIVPRHHDPEQLLKHSASKSRSRSKSQELILSARMSDMPVAQRASTPSPRLGAIETSSSSSHALLPTPPLSPSGSKMYSDSLFSKHLSLLHNSNLILPPPPMGQQPEPPTSSSNVSTPTSSRPTSLLYHKHSLSNSSLRSVGSSSSIGSHSTTSFGGAIHRKHSNRDSSSMLSARLSTLTPIPLGSATSVPLPPQTALPPIPMSIPTPPTSAPPAPPSDAKNGEDAQGNMLVLDMAVDGKMAQNALMQKDLVLASEDAVDVAHADVAEAMVEKTVVAPILSAEGVVTIKSVEIATEALKEVILQQTLKKQPSTCQMILEEDEETEQDSLELEDKINALEIENRQCQSEPAISIADTVAVNGVDVKETDNELAERHILPATSRVSA
ncbi:hypothetical protein EDD11_006213 [Mortierella claussenii]|nr:hypothetical protein EDD11_006213 [Mortierella claussenii]